MSDAALFRFIVNRGDGKCSRVNRGKGITLHETAETHQSHDVFTIF